MRKLLLVTSFFLMTAVVWAQERTVSGKVTSADDGSTLPGVNVILKGTSTGTVTDVDGNYKLNVPSSGGVLVFSFVGLETTEVEIGSRSVIDLQMSSDIQQLNEVVVTALGVSREKKAIGYSVQEVNTEELAQASEPNVVNALQGQVAGVQIQGTSGTLGGSSRITVRGSSSFLGENQPLFVVDGMPINNDNYANSSQLSGFGGGSYDYGNAASDINPEDIASMSVLKGASATALYGARGANGVILITTKSGKKSKGVGIEFNSRVTFDKAQNLIEHQTRYGGGATLATPSGFNEFTFNGETQYAPVYSKDGAWGPKYDPNMMVRHWDSWDPQSSNYGETRPWVAPANDYSEFFETGVTLQNSIAFSGGNENGTFRIGYTNLDQSGTMPNSELGRNTFNINASYNLSDKLTVSGSGNLVKSSANGRNATGYSNSNPMQGFTQWWQTQLDVTRLENYKWQDGTQYTWNATGIGEDSEGNLTWNPAPYFFDNPYWVRNEFLQEDTRDRFYGNIAANYELAEGLSVSARAMTDGFTFQSREGIPNGGVDQSFYSETTRTFTETNYEAKLMYNKQINDFISVDAIVGGNLMSQERKRVTANTNGGLALDGFFNIGNGLGNPTVTTNVQEKEINSIFASASVGLYSTVFVDFTMRNDWSSTLPTESNSYFYPAVTTSFVFTELGALQNSSILSFGKLRLGYGLAGNDADPYQLYNVYAPQAPNFGNNPRYAVPNSRNNPNLVNELTKEFEVGLEMNFLQNRLGFELAYYDRTTEEQIFAVASSATTGYTSRIVNAGSMKNSGIELALRGTPIQSGDFSWDVNVNFATYNNEVVELAPGVDNIILGNTWAADVRLQQGQPYMALFGQDFKRNENGEIVVGSNGIPVTETARQYLGSAVADFTGGVRNVFSYKGITASALIDFQSGGVIHSTSLQWAAYSGMLPKTAEGNIREEGMIINGVKAVYNEEGEVIGSSDEANDVAVDPQVYYQSVWSVAAPNVYDASFIKLREVRLGYTLPQSMLGNLPFRDVNVAFVGRNLGLLYSEVPYLDPQSVTGTGNVQGLENAQVPTTRSYGFNLSFKL